MTNRNVQRRIDSIQADDRGLDIDNPFYLRIPVGNTANRPGPTQPLDKLDSQTGMIRFNNETGNIELFLPEVDSGGVPTSVTTWTSIGLGTDPLNPAQGDFLQRFGGIMSGDLRMAQQGPFGTAVGTGLSDAQGTGLQSGNISAADFSRVLNADGSAAEPSYTFDLDLDTGISRTADNELTLSTGGVARLVINSSGLTFPSSTLFGDGTEGSPSISFTNNPDAGFYREGADIIGGSIRGFQAIEIRPLVGGNPPSRANTEVVIRGNLTVDGTTTEINAPDLIVVDNTIILNSGEGGAGITLGNAGTEIDRGSLANVSWIYDEGNDYWAPAGPGGLLGDLTVIGIERPNTIGNLQELNTRQAGLAGTPLFINAGSIRIRNSGAAAVPGPGAPHGSPGNTSYSFEGDSDTGIYHPLQNALGLVASGDEILRIDRTDGTNPHARFSRQARAETQPFLPAQNADESIPSWSFISDSDTGVGSNAADELELIVGGNVALRLTNTGGSGQLLLDDGTIAAPSLAFKLDPDTGFRRSSSGVIKFVSDAVDSVTLAAGGVGVPDGSQAAPGLFFNSDFDTGIFHPASSDQVALTTGGQTRFIATTTSVISRSPNRGVVGSAALPTYSFETDIDTGMFLNTPGNIGLTTAGQLSASFNGGQAVFPTGSSINPGVAFLTDSDTGMFRPAANTLALATDGSERLRITDTGDVGIGAIPTTGKLVINGGDITTTNPLVSQGNVLELQTTNTAVANAKYGISFRATTSPSNEPLAFIKADSDFVSNFNTSLVFGTRPAVSGSAIERLRIGSDGIILVASGSRLFLDVDPVSNLEAATKQYVDNEITTAAGTSAGDFVNVTGDTMTDGLIINSANDVKLTLQGSASPRIRFESNTDDVYQIDVNGGGFRINNATDSTTEMQFDGAGRVGIGTTSPLARVDIRNPENNESLLVLATSVGNQDTVARFQRSTTTLFTDPNTSILVLENDNAPGDSVAMKFQGSGTHNVFGIIAGANASQTLRLNITGTQVDVMKWNVISATEAQTLFRDGNVGNPSIAFDDDRNTGIFRPTTDTIGFSTGGTEKIRIIASGNVGVGTTSPKSKLHIAGFGDTISSGNNISEILRFDNKSIATNMGIVFDTNATPSTTSLRGFNIGFQTQDFSIVRFDDAGVAGATTDFTINSIGEVNIPGATTISGLDYPTSDGTAGQVITTDGSGNLTFTSAGIGLTDKVDKAGDTMTGNLQMDTSSIRVGNAGPSGATNLTPGDDGSINAEEMFINNNRVATVDEATALAIVFGG